MNSQVIKSYLVSLGYEVDQPMLNRFNDALRATTQQVSSFTGGMTKAFIEAGAAVVTALSGVAIGTVSLMESTARADLGYQLFARRMFMSADAAKSLKIATDALGFSLQDIIWGPPELRERYHQLIADQKQLQQGLGGAGFEAEMRKLRDISFEFTRLKVEAQYFVMGLAKALSVALTGDENGLLRKLRDWNEWLIANIPRLADEFSAYLAPVLRDTAAIWHDIADILRIVSSEFIQFVGVIYGDDRLKKGETNIRNFGTAMDYLAGSVKTVFDYFKSFFDWVEQHPYFVKTLLGASLGGRIGAVAGPWGILGGLAAGGAAGYYEAYKGEQGKSSGTAPSGKLAGTPIDSFGIKAAIVAAARSAGVDPALALAIASKESGMNPHAPHRPGDGYGMMQVLPGTFAQYGSGDINNFQDNLQASMKYLAALGAQYGGNEYLMAKRYNSSGRTSAGELRGEAYAADVMQRAHQYNFTINVQVESGASPHEIGHHVANEVHKKLKEISKMEVAQASGVHA